MKKMQSSFCNNLEFLQQKKKCTSCQYGIQSVNGGSLRCNKCHQRCYFYDGTFFQNLKLPISKILERGYFWLNYIRVTSMRNICGVSNQTALEYFEKFEDLVSLMIDNPNLKSVALVLSLKLMNPFL